MTWMPTHSSNLAAMLVVLLAVVAPHANAQDRSVAAVDARVEKLLKEAAAEYTIDEEGDFRLVHDLGDGRSQLVWIPSGTTLLGALEIRQIWSLAYRTQSPLPSNIANKLLDRNGVVILGAWLTQQAADELGVIFAAQLPAETDALSLRSAVHAVATTADSLEKDLTGQDQF
jgi:hypothetical protein